MQKVRTILQIMIVSMFTIAFAEYTALGHLHLFSQPIYLTSTYLFVISLGLFLYCLLNKGGLILLMLFGQIFGTINYYMLDFRGNLLYLSDLKTINTALAVSGNYDLIPDAHLCTCWIVFVICCIMSILFVKKTKRGIGHIISGISGIIGMYILCIYMSVFPPNYFNGWERCGTIMHFIICSYDASAEAPESLDEDIEWYENTYSDEIKNVENLPDIVVIVDESFSDYSIYDIETNTDLIPYTKKLMEESIYSGIVYSSVLGGGTSCTEWEFLTGSSSLLYPSTGPFQSYVKADKESLPSWLKSLGYQTYAFHPFYEGAYARAEVYPKLGFDEFISAEDMPMPKTYPRALQLNGLSFMSDYDMFNYLADFMSKKDVPGFYYCMTIQNHGGYETGLNEIDVSDPELAEYLSLCNQTDKALEIFINKIKERERDTIVLFFGDHQPSISTNMTEDATISQQVPFLIWSNKGINKNEINQVTSMNYLSLYLIEAAGLPKAAWQQFLTDLQKEYPVISQKVVMNTAYELTEFTGGLSEKYNSILYDRINR